jgi:flagellar assembly protein FliH
MSFDVLKAGTFVEIADGVPVNLFRGGRQARIEALERELDEMRRELDERIAREGARVREECERKATEEWGNASRAMREAAIAMRRAAEAGLRGSEEEIVTLAIAVASRILGREAAVDGEHVAALVRRLLTRVADPGSVRLRVHPADHARILGERDAIQLESGLVDGITVVSDRRVARGSCILETPDFVVDGSRQGQLAAARAALEGKGT